MLGNIERFLELKHELGSSVEADVQIVRLSETDAEVAEFVERWRRSRADIMNIKELDTWGGQIDEVSGLAVDGDEAAEPVAAQVPDGTVDGERLPCPNLWYHCHIHWDGVLVSCSRDYDAVTPLGNVRNGGVLETWHGARMRQMREWHAGGNFCAAPVPAVHGVVLVAADAVRRRRHRRQGEPRRRGRGGGSQMAVAIRERREPAAAGAAEAAFRVIWLGERPWWLDDPGARAELDGIEPGPPVPGRARPLVVHARASVLPHVAAGLARTARRGHLRGDRLDRACARVARSARSCSSTIPIGCGRSAAARRPPGRSCACRSTWRSTRR